MRALALALAFGLIAGNASAGVLDWLSGLFGHGGDGYFEGYMPCPGEKYVLDRCSGPNHTTFVFGHFPPLECAAHVEAAKAAGGPGGSCR
jgi:hypothetical protein